MAQHITIVHATRHSLAPVKAAFAEGWPAAETEMLVDEALLAERRAADGLTPALYDRIEGLARRAADGGAACVLFSCSAFGPAIEAARAALEVPVFKPYEPMIEVALAAGSRLALLATFGPTIEEMAPEVEAAAGGREIALATAVVEGALEALNGGRADEHDARIAAAAARHVACDALMLGQYSMAGAAALIPDLPGRRVLTSPGCAVAKLKAMLGP